MFSEIMHKPVIGTTLAEISEVCPDEANSLHKLMAEFGLTEAEYLRGYYYNWNLDGVSPNDAERLEDAFEELAQAFAAATETEGQKLALLPYAPEYPSDEKPYFAVLGALVYSRAANRFDHLLHDMHGIC